MHFKNFIKIKMKGAESLLSIKFIELLDFSIKIFSKVKHLETYPNATSTDQKQNVSSK